MYEYFSLEEKIISLQRYFNIDFKDLRSCNHQENNNIIAYKNIKTNYIYKYDMYTNYWMEDKDDVYNYEYFGFEDKNYELK